MLEIGEREENELKIAKDIKKRYEKSMKRYKKDLKNFERRAKMEDLRSNALAFVCLESKAQVDLLLKSQKRLKCWICRLGRSSRKPPKLLRAVDPSDINWNFIGYSTWERLRSVIKINILIFAFLLGMVYITFLSNITVIIFTDLTNPDMNRILVLVIDYIPTIILVLFTKMVSDIIEAYLVREIHLNKKRYFTKRTWLTFWIDVWVWGFAFMMDLITVYITDGEKGIEQVAYFGMKFTIVKAILEPLLTVADYSYFFSKSKRKMAQEILNSFVKARRAVEGDPRRLRQLNKLKYYHKSALKRLAGKSYFCLEKKYSRVISIVFMDLMLSYITRISPIVSMVYLVLQTVADRKFFIKRYRDPYLQNPEISVGIVNMLALIPRLIIFNKFFDVVVFQCCNLTLYHFVFDSPLFVIFFLDLRSISLKLLIWYRRRRGGRESVQSLKTYSKQVEGVYNAKQERYEEVKELFVETYESKKTQAITIMEMDEEEVEALEDGGVVLEDGADGDGGAGSPQSPELQEGRVGAGH